MFLEPLSPITCRFSIGLLLWMKVSWPLMALSFQLFENVSMSLVSRSSYELTKVEINVDLSR